jgi:hypothetical protein
VIRWVLLKPLDLGPDEEELAAPLEVAWLALVKARDSILPASVARYETPGRGATEDASNDGIVLIISWLCSLLFAGTFSAGRSRLPKKFLVFLKVSRMCGGRST